MQVKYNHSSKKPNSCLILYLPFTLKKKTMEKQINLKIKDYRDSFHEPHKKKPYYLFIEYGSQNFVFSNKEKAKRFLAKFKKESTLLYKELGYHLSSLHMININLAHVQHYSEYLKISNRLHHFGNRYSKVLNSSKGIDIQIGREINNAYYELDSIYLYFRDFLARHNRLNGILQDVRFKMKAIRRLRRDFDLLLLNAEGVNEITNLEIKSIKYNQILRIA